MIPHLQSIFFFGILEEIFETVFIEREMEYGSGSEDTAAAAGPDVPDAAAAAAADHRHLDKECRARRRACPLPRSAWHVLLDP